MAALSELISEIAEVTHIPEAEVKDVVQALIEISIQKLEAGESVQIRGLGTLKWVRSGKKRFRHINTKELWEYAQGHERLVFKPSTKIKRRR